MNHYAVDDYPERGKPKKAVTFTDNHKLVLRAIFWHHRQGTLATDESIFDAIVKAKGRVISPSGSRTRRHELVAEFKYVTESPVRGKTESGRKCATYRLTDSGKAKAQELWEASRQMRLAA